MKKSALLLVLLFGITISSFGQRRGKKDPPKMGNFVAAAHFKDFIPISPMDFEQNVVFYDKSRHAFDTLSIKELASEKTKIITFLPNETVYSTVEKNDDSAEAKFGPASVTAQSGNYTVTLDYAKFTTLKFRLDDASCAGFTKVGVGMRITAKITTFEAGVDVSSLFGLGLAARTGTLRGQLTIDIIGMESSKITDLISMPVDISEASIQTALQSLSAIKSKIYDEETNLYPQILAVKKTDGSCSAIDLLENAELGGDTQLLTKQQRETGKKGK